MKHAGNRRNQHRRVMPLERRERHTAYGATGFRTRRR